MPRTQDILIKALDLTPHEEGGFFARTFQSEEMIQTRRPHQKGERHLATSIYYMLTRESPVGHFHCNASPILHFHHGGAPLVYRYFDRHGRAEEHVLGPDLAQGHVLQLLVPGDCWKATELGPGDDYGLISEVVFPGWQADDCIMGRHDELLRAFPAHKAWIDKYAYRTVPDRAGH